MRFLNPKDQTRRNEAELMAAKAENAKLKDCIMFLSMMTDVEIPTLEEEEE